MSWYACDINSLICIIYSFLITSALNKLVSDYPNNILTSSWYSATPFDFSFNHFVHICSRWISQKKTQHSTKTNILYYLALNSFTCVERVHFFKIVPWWMLTTLPTSWKVQFHQFETMLQTLSSGCLLAYYTIKNIC